MSWSRFEYFLNVLHYFLWLKEIKFNNIAENNVKTLFSFVHKFFFSEEYKKKYSERWDKVSEERDKLYYSKEIGLCITWANHLFGLFYSCYFSIIPFIAMGLYIRITQEFNPLIVFFMFLIPALLCYQPVNRAVYSNKRYLKYFKKFEKENEQWHKKWGRITTAFCIGGILTFLAGVVVAFLIVMV